MAGRTAALALLVVLVVLSGCQFVGTTGGDPTPTATPAPVPTVATEATDTPNRFDLPPGVSRRGVTSTAELAFSHYRAVVGTSYVWSDRYYNRAGGNASSVAVISHRVRMINGTRYSFRLSERRAPAPDGRDGRWWIEQFADGTRQYSRYRLGDDVRPEYTIMPATNASAGFATIAIAQIGLYLDLPDASIAAVDIDGERYYRIAAERDTYTSDSLYNHRSIDARNYTARAVVSPDGFVTRLNVSYTAGNGTDGRIERSPGDRVHYSFAYRQVGTATVEPPDWLDEATQHSDRERRLSGDDDTTTTSASGSGD